MPTLRFILNITFDSSIEKIDITYGSFTNTYTDSNYDMFIQYEPGSDLYMDVTLKAGYSIDTTTLGTITGNRITIAAENININVTLNCTITTKAASSKLSIDLTTLPGWANLSSGNHTIKIKAKGTGYIDSELSAGVVVSKAAETVTLEAGTYKFVDNPTLPTPAITENFSFMSSNTSFDKLIVNINRRIVYSVEGDTLGVYYNNAWTDTAYQTITLSTDQQVSAAFYKWAITDGNLVKQVEPAAYTDCLTFTGETSEFTLKATNKEWDGTVEYSTDHNTWTVWNGTAVSSVDKKLYLRGNGNTKFYTSNGAYLSLSARAACSGNIQTLLEYSNPPAAVPNHCYRNMFRDCTNLTAAPELPATTLASGCYQYMFNGCTSLTTTPELPATTLADFCYQYMFNGCTNLTAAPELPATTLAAYCYRNMFNGCTSLKISAAQSSEYSTAWRIPSSGTISSTAMNWNTSMLSNTGGTFTSNPSINTTYYGAW